MNHWARILSELKITLARTPFRDWPAVILLWLHLRRLTEALDTLFTAWREGALPPPPAQPTLEVAAIPPRAPAAPKPRPARTPSYPRAPRAAAPAATPVPTAAAPARRRTPTWAHLAPQPARPALPPPQSKNCDILAIPLTHALYVPI